MTLKPMLIAPFATGLDTDLSPWIAPTDSFREAVNVHLRHGIMEKRSGLQLFGSLSSGDRVMGIARYINADGSKRTLAWDTTRAYRFNAVTDVFDILDAAAIMSGDDEDFIWTVNWQATGLSNRLYFTNGKVFDGATLDGIRFYDDSGATTTSFTPDLNTTGTRILWGAKLLFAIKGRLLVLNTFERDTGTGTTTNFAQRMRWCAFQNPNNWNDVSKPGGGFFDAPTGDQIISARQIQDEIIVFFTSSVWKITPVSDPSLPYRWIKINSFRACDGKMASVAYDRYVGALGVRGITASDTNQTVRIDDRIQNFVVDTINVDSFPKVFCERDYQNKRWWTLYTSGDSTESNFALIYDDDTKGYTTYEIALNCLGYGNASRDFGLDDFSVANGYDYDLNDMSDETLQSYYWQDNEEIFLGGDISGDIFITEESGDDNGNQIESTMRTNGWNPYQKEGVEARFSYIDFYVDTQQSTKATIEFFKNSDISPYTSQMIDFLPDLGFIASINNITQANPANVNAPDHGLSTGDVVFIYGVEGMDAINSLSYTITVVDVDNFTLDGIDSTAFDPYTAGGGLYEREFYRDRIWKRAYAGGIGNEHSIRITSGGIDRPFLFHAFKPYFKAIGTRTID